MDFHFLGWNFVQIGHWVLYFFPIYITSHIQCMIKKLIHANTSRQNQYTPALEKGSMGPTEWPMYNTWYH